MQQQANAAVSLLRCEDYSSVTLAGAIARQFDLLGGIGKFVTRGDSVLLKPNFIAPKPRRCATQTDPAVLIETAKLLKDFGAKPFVADSPAWADVFACAKALDLEEPLRRLDVPIRQLDEPVRREIGGVTVGISSVALGADVIINLPKFKTHQPLVATFAVKNMFGCVSGKWKAYWHFAKGSNEQRFCKFLIDIYKFMKPAVTIIDAVTAMDGRGPINGRARPFGWLVGGTEPIAMEYVCCKLAGIRPEELPIIRTAGEMGFGCRSLDGVTISGDALPQNGCTDFILAEPTPIRFSLLHVCKSVCKQILLLARRRTNERPGEA